MAAVPAVAALRSLPAIGGLQPSRDIEICKLNFRFGSEVALPYPR